SLVKKLTAISGINEVAMTTNGILLPEMIDDLKDAGLSRINISLDTLDPEKYRTVTRMGELGDALKGIRAALDSGLPIKINTVLIGGFNDDEIPDLVALTKKYPIEMRFIELMPMRGQVFPKDAFISCGEVLNAVPELKREGRKGSATVYSLSGSVGKVGLIGPLSDSFCASCNRIRLTADGKLKPCLHSSDEIDINGLHGDELTGALKEAIMKKPACHGELSFKNESMSKRSMNAIGG
ncbi:MAG: radical SAM protein, partial [Clostridiales bacterium]|nr:radical SAM protein [Clostridiales bacterium]